MSTARMRCRSAWVARTTATHCTARAITWDRLVTHASATSDGAAMARPAAISTSAPASRARTAPSAASRRAVRAASRRARCAIRSRRGCLRWTRTRVRVWRASRTACVRRAGTRSRTRIRNCTSPAAPCRWVATAISTSTSACRRRAATMVAARTRGSRRAHHVGCWPRAQAAWRRAALPSTRSRARVLQDGATASVTCSQPRASVLPSVTC